MIVASRRLPSILDAAAVPMPAHAIVGAGECLGFYTAMARLGSTTVLELAMAAHASAWFVEAWLKAQVRAGYVVEDPGADRYSLFCRITPDAEPPRRYAGK